MSHTSPHEVAPRHFPVAHARDPRPSKKPTPAPANEPSESRLQAARVVREVDENDPHADVPCTD